MAITRGQKSTLGQVGSGSGVTTTWSVNPAAGNSILVFVQCIIQPTSVVDNGTTPATFTPDVTNTNASGAYVYRANNITLPSAGSYAVTVSGASGHTYQALGIEYAGMKAGAPDATNVAHATGTSISSGGAAPAAAGGVVFGGFSDNSGLVSETITFTGSSPEVEQTRNVNGSSYVCMAAADALTGSSQTLTWTIGDSQPWCAVIAAYSPASGGGGGISTNPSWDPSGAWTVIFDDEFTGTTLNPVWQPGWFGASGITAPVNTGVSPQNNSANVSVSGGTLNLTLGSVGGTVYGALVTTNPTNSATASGFQTGPPAAFEARIFVPGPDGAVQVPNWVSWWTDGQSWPGTGEIDILESLGTPDWNAVHVHDNATDGPGGTGAPGITHNQSPPYGWHTFGAYWKTPASNTVEFFYDGASIGSLNTDGFTGPHYLILSNTYSHAADITPTTMQVDWVRVWTPGSTGRTVTAGLATGTGAALGPSAASSGNVTVTAGLATGTGAALAAAATGMVPSVPVSTVLPVLPQIIVEAGLAADAPVQGGTTFILDSATQGVLDTSTLGTSIAWTDISQWVLGFGITRPSTRLQGPLWNYQAGTASITLDNSDGRFDVDNLSGGPYVVGGVTSLAAMVPVRIRTVFSSTGYPLYSGFADGWLPAQVTYEGGYAELTVPCTDAFKVLAGITLAAASVTVAGADTGARIRDILTRAGWYTSGDRSAIGTGNSTLQGTTLGDTALNLMQIATDSEIGQLYVNGSGAVVFRPRRALLTDTRSNTVQAVFGDLPGTVQAAGTELAYAAVTRASDDTTIANDVQATRTSGILQEARDTASIAKYMFARTYSRADLILSNDSDALNWAQWVLYISKSGEDRFESLQIDPAADPYNLWPQVLGREIGDRIQVWHRPAGVASPISKDCFIAGITHAWNSATSEWLTTWTLQDASKFGSFFTLDNATLGRLDSNALTF